MNATRFASPRFVPPHRPPPALINVAVIESSARLREGLAALLNGTSGFRCSGAFADAESALVQLAGRWPDVLLTDVSLPKMSGASYLAKLKTQRPTLQILVLTLVDEPGEILEAFMAGASGYLLKTTPPAEILTAIADLHQGGAPISSHIARKVVEYFQNMGYSTDVSSTVSKREMEVLALLAKGYRYKEIASQLSISTLTVRSHLTRIYDKLHVHSRTEAVIKFLNGRIPSKA